jgi:acetylornithine deacetylase/succinyl-diaminopimelate desuccinylase-like protein
MKRIGLAILAAALAGWANAAPPLPPPAVQAEAHAILQHMIDTDTTHARGSTGLAEWIADQARGAGYPAADVQVLAPPGHPTKGNVVIRLRGKGLSKPLLVLGHLDVVEANPEDWTVPPFKLTEKDGYFYGRGTQDMKGDDAITLTTALRLKREGFVPDRDIIFAFTADEEGGGDADGPKWLYEAHPELVAAGVSINQDGDGITLKDGKPLYLGVEAAEKLYVTYQLETTNRGGHSSVPRADDAMYQMIDGLKRLEAYAFPAKLNPVTRAYFARYGALLSGQARADTLAIARGELSGPAAARLSRDPLTNALLRTTCTPTVIKGGQGESALPERVDVTIQCRLMPGETPEGTAATLKRVLADPGIKLTTEEPIDPSGETQPDPKILARYRAAAAVLFPDAVVIPDMSTGASDSVYSRAAGVPSYVSSAIPIDIDDHREHGRDERIRVSSFYEGVAYMDRLLKVMSAKD